MGFKVEESVNEAKANIYGIEYRESPKDKKFKKSSLTMSSSRGLSGHKSMTMAIIKRADKVKKQEGWSEYRITVNGQPYIHWGGKRLTRYPKPQINNQVESVNERMDKRQAAETLKQLGGNKFIAMTGAKNFGFGSKGMVFKIGRNSKGVNYVRIDLRNDLYDMEFIQMRAGKEKIKSKIKGVYNDQLQKIFTKHTGMYTRL